MVVMELFKPLCSCHACMANRWAISTLRTAACLAVMRRDGKMVPAEALERMTDDLMVILKEINKDVDPKGDPVANSIKFYDAVFYCARRLAGGEPNRKRGVMAKIKGWIRHHWNEAKRGWEDGK